MKYNKDWCVFVQLCNKPKANVKVNVELKQERRLFAISLVYHKLRPARLPSRAVLASPYVGAFQVGWFVCRCDPLTQTAVMLLMPRELWLRSGLSPWTISVIYPVLVPVNYAHRAYPRAYHYLRPVLMPRESSLIFGLEHDFYIIIILILIIIIMIILIMILIIIIITL